MWSSFVTAAQSDDDGGGDGDGDDNGFLLRRPPPSSESSALISNNSNLTSTSTSTSSSTAAGRGQMQSLKMLLLPSLMLLSYIVVFFFNAPNTLSSATATTNELTVSLTNDRHAITISNNHHNHHNNNNNSLKSSGSTQTSIHSSHSTNNREIILMPDMIGDEIDNNELENNNKSSSSSSSSTSSNDDGGVEVLVPDAYKRCAYVVDTFERRNANVSDKKALKEMYMAQSVDYNIFYRATAILFWWDFAAGTWGKDQHKSLKLDDLVGLRFATYEDGSTPMSPFSTWTWITGDQHLSNFGAWRNRGGEVVYSVNDFDEAAIYDFQLDILRIAVSICNHGATNGFHTDQIKEALEAFLFTYVDTVIKYVGGDKELEYELTPNTSVGALRDFLSEVAGHDYDSKTLKKFTKLGMDGELRFRRDDKSRLVSVDDKEMENKIRAEFTSTRYGASMMKMGWCVPGWDDTVFTVLDVASRVGSGIGSFGVDRFYVLLKGTEASKPVILDVKYEPTSAVMEILQTKAPETKAWYDNLFNHEADRSAQGQRRLTSYTDPYVGFLIIDNKPYTVRERSPYKESFDLDTLKNQREFNEFIEQVAIATATAHTRGTVSKSPGQFKHAIKLLLAGQHKRDRWSKLVTEIAIEYSNQVQLDFECFVKYANQYF